MKKRIVSMLLCVCMVIGMLPAVLLSAAAADAPVTVYLQNDAGWASPYVYCWTGGSQDSNANWPGMAMTKVEGESNIWSYTVEAGFDMVIFNDGGSSQTADLNLPTDGLLLYNNNSSSWSSYTPEGSGDTDSGIYSVKFDLLNITTDGTATVAPDANYSAALTPVEGYALPETVIVSVGGTVVTGYSFENGVITIPADLITGNITITASGVLEDTSSCVASVTTQQGGISYYTDFLAALTDASNAPNSTLTMLSGVTLSAYPDLTAGTFTLDLNGQIISTTAAYVFRFPGESTANVTVVDSKSGGEIQGKSTKTGIYQKGGSLTLVSGKISGATGITAAKGTLTILGGTVSGSSQAIQANYSADAVVNIEGGVVTCTGVATTTYGILMKYGTLNMSGGSVSGCYGVYVEKATANISDKASITGNIASALYLKTTGTINVFGGSVSGNSSDIEVSTTATGAVTLTGGTFPNGITVSNTTLETILAEGYHYFAGGSEVTITTSDTAITDQGDVIVSDVPVVKDPVINLSFASLAFEDEVYYNIYFTTESLDAESTDMSLLIWDEEPTTATVDTADRVLHDFLYDSQSDWYTARTDGVAAKKMGDLMYFVICAQLEDGSYIYSNLVYYSAKMYAMSQLGSTDSEELESLCVAMLNYGAAAQVHFGYKTDTLMNVDLNEVQQNLVDNYDPSMVADRILADSSKLGEFAATDTGFSRKIPSISFEGAFAINYYFTTSVAAEDVTFYYWTAEAYAAASDLTADNASGILNMTAAGEANQFWAIVEGIAAKDIDQTVFACGVYTVDGVTYCTGVIAYSLGYYCRNMAAGTGTIGDLASATAVYGYYAKAFFTA